MAKKKIIFFGTAAFAVPILKALINRGFCIVAVVTQPDKPQGRKQKLISSPIKELAIKNGLKIIEPAKLKVTDINNLNADLGICAGYGQIIQNQAINQFPFGIINIHPSLLPKYRGPSPIQFALLNNDKITGVTLMQMNEGLDTGPIIAQKKMIIADSDNAEALSDKLAKLAADLLINCFNDYLNKKISLTSQNIKEVSYSQIIKKGDGKIDLKDDPRKILQKNKAFHPWPGVFFMLKNKRFKIIKAHLGKKNMLAIDLIQPEGKKVMSFKEFKMGYGKLISDFFSGIES